MPPPADQSAQPQIFVCQDVCYLGSRPRNLAHPTTMTTAIGPALVVGSLGTAQDGRYQNLIVELSQSEELRSLGSNAVERQILDRILDGGESVLSRL